MRIQLSTTQTCSRTMTWLWSIRLCLLSFFWNTNTHHKMIQYIMEFYNKSKRSSNQKIRQHNSTWKWKKYTHDTNRVFIHHPYRLVLWCSGYHVCFTRRRSRVRTSPEPLTFERHFTGCCWWLVCVTLFLFDVLYILFAKILTLPMLLFI